MILLVPMHTKATAEPMDEVKYKDIMDGLIDTARAYYARGLNYNMIPTEKVYILHQKTQHQEIKYIQCVVVLYL